MTRILSRRRRISVCGALGINGIKYQSAGRVQRGVVSPSWAMSFIADQQLLLKIAAPAATAVPSPKGRQP